MITPLGSTKTPIDISPGLTPASTKCTQSTVARGTQQRHDDGSRGDPLRKGGKFNAAAEEQTSHTKQPLHSTVPCPRIF